VQDGRLEDSVTAVELLESLPCIVYVVRPTVPPTVLFVTANIESYTGYRPEHFYADDSLAFQCIHPDDRERAVARVLSAMHEKACYTVEGRVCHRSGKATYHMAVRSVPVTSSDGNVILRQGVVLDITEQKRLEAALHRSQRLAAIGEMAAMMAHEIRNPLAGMSLATRSLRSDDTSQKVRDECLDDLEACLKRIDDTVSRALDFSKTRPLLRRDCSLADVLTRAQRLVASYMRRNDVTLLTELPDDLPVLQADPDQLEQVFVDLILNACQAMPDGGQVTVRARMDGHVLRVEVTDTGIGIPPERLGEVFSPFYSGFSDGAGLGLSLCRRILASHDGHIRVTSTVGQGSTFHLELPQEPSDGAGPSDR
jgi:PAS domain S-box-containing protein